MSAVIGSLRANLTLNTAAFETGVKRAQASMSNMERGLSRASARMSRIGGVMTVGVTAPVTLGLRQVVRATAEWEAALNRSNALLKPTTAQIKTLEATTRELGRTTKFTAAQAAEGVEILARNGLRTEQILGGALSASLSVAAAGGAELGAAADVVTDSLVGFNIAAEKSQFVADQMAGVLSTSKFAFDDYRLALAQAGGVAGGLGVSFDDFNTALAGTASLFASGSDAGTSYKTFITSLVPKSAAAAAAMENLGLEFYDAQGNMLAMEDIAGNLQTSLEGLSDAARTEALSDIFGRDAIRTAIGLADLGREGFARLREEIGDTSAVDLADARMKGFSGSMERLRSAIDGLMVAIGTSGLIDIFTTIATGMAEWVNRISQLNPAMLKFAAVGATLAAALGPVLVTLGAVAGALTLLLSPVGLVVAAAAGLAAGVAVVVLKWDSLTEKFPVLGKAADVVSGALRWMWGTMEQVGGIAGKLVLSFARLAVAAANSAQWASAAWEKFADKYPETASRIEAATEVAKSGYRGLLAEISDFGKSNFTQIEELGDAVTALLDGDWKTALSTVGGMVKDSMAAWSDLAGAVKDIYTQTLPDIISELTGWDLRAEATRLADDFKDGLKSLSRKAKEAFGEAWEAIRLEVLAWPGRLKNLGKLLIDGLIEGIKSKIDAAVNAVKGLFERVIKGGEDVVEVKSPSRVFHRIGAYTVEGFVQGIDANAGDAVAAIERMGRQTVDAGSGLADDLGRLIGDGLWTNFEDAADRVRDIFRRLLSDLIAQAAGNQIRIALGLQNSVGGAGIAQFAAGGAQGVGGIGGALGAAIGSSGGLGVLGGLTGLVQNTLANGVGGAVSYLTSTASLAAGEVGALAAGTGTLTGALGGLGAAVGAIGLPILGITAIMRGFRTQTETTKQGFEVAATGMDLAVRKFERVKESRFWGLQSSESETYSAAGKSGDPIRAAFRQAQDGVLSLGETLGVVAEDFEGFSRTLRVDLLNKNAADRAKELERELGKLTHAMAATALEAAATAEQTAAAAAAGVKVYELLAKQGENADDVLTRLANSLSTVNGMFDYMGRALLAVDAGGGAIASALVDAFGSPDNFTAGVSNYIQKFYSETERTRMLAGDLADTLAEFGATLPGTRAALRGLVDGLDLTTDRGRRLYATLIQNADAFDQLLPSVEALTRAIYDAVLDTGGALDEAIAGVQTALLASKQAATAWYTVAGTLRNFVRELRTTDLGGGSASARLAASRAAYDSAVTAARGGDQTALGNLPELARSLLDNTRATARTGEDYRFAANQIQSQLSLLAGVAELSGANEDVLAELYREQIAIMQRLSDFLKNASSLTTKQIENALGRFDLALGDVSAAIADVKSFSYDALVKQVDVLVSGKFIDALPPHIGQLLASAATGIQTRVDFILRRDDLTPDLKWIATRGNWQALQKLDFVANTKGLPRRLRKILIGQAETFSARISAAVDLSNLTKRQKRLLDLVGGKDGKITLGGSFEFDPAGAFGQQLDTLASPMDGLRSSLDALRAEIAAQVQAEAEAAKRAAQIAKVQARLAAVVGKQDGLQAEVGSAISDFFKLADKTGVKLRDAAGNSASIGFDQRGVLQSNYAQITGSSGDISEFKRKNDDLSDAIYQKGRSGAWETSRRLADRADKLRAQIEALGAIPQFAAGGDHMGGLHIVGERGIELRAGGPARYKSNAQLRDMMTGAGEITALRQEVAAMRSDLVQLGVRGNVHTKKTADLIQYWEGVGLPKERP